MSKKIIDTSRAAYASLDPESISTMYKAIVAGLRKIGSGTYEDIAKVLKLKPEKVWKRLSEAQKLGLIERTEMKKKLKSGREGYVWKATASLPITESAMPGKTVSDYSKALTQPTLSPYIQKQLF